MKMKWEHTWKQVGDFYGKEYDMSSRIQMVTKIQCQGKNMKRKTQNT